MTHIVSARCIDCRYTDCCVVCPVECFYEIDDPRMLVIDPSTCIDCQLCVPACPVNAIYADTELPESYAEMAELNALLFEGGRRITEQKGPLDGALDLEGVRARERAGGWPVVEPGNAAH